MLYIMYLALLIANRKLHDDVEHVNNIKRRISHIDFSWIIGLPLMRFCTAMVEICQFLPEKLKIIRLIHQMYQTMITVTSLFSLFIALLTLKSFLKYVAGVECKNGCLIMCFKTGITVWCWCNLRANSITANPLQPRGENNPL